MSLPEIAGHELRELIGTGNCGAVYRGTTAAGKGCAIKVLSSMAINRKELGMVMEKLLRMPHHQGVLPLEAGGLDRSPYHWVMPLVGSAVKDGQGRSQWRALTLEDTFMSRVPSDKGWEMIYEMADALAWLHRHSIPHGNLRASNVLVESDGSIRITDMAQGWVGGTYNLVPTDHAIYLHPDQMENPGAVFAGYGPSWDVYSFGVLAYRLLTGRLPRAESAWADQVKQMQARSASGLASQIDSNALMDAVRAQPQVVWPTAAATKWEQRRMDVISKALDLDENNRWRDMREVIREFEIMDADYLLESAQEATVQERLRQRAKVRTLTLIATALLATLSAATMYAFFTWRRAVGAERTIAENAAGYQTEIATREAKIADLSQQRDLAQQLKVAADTNLQHSQLAVDQFLTQLLQTPTGNDLEVEFSRNQLDDALKFCMQNVEGLENAPDLLVERARTYGNIGQIHLRLHEDVKAREYLEKARIACEQLIAKSRDGDATALHHQWLGRYNLLLSDISGRAGETAASKDLLKAATTHLQEGLAADPKNRLARLECARSWMEYGSRCLDSGELAEAESALQKVPEVMDEKIIGAPLSLDERFMLARACFNRGRAARDQNKTEEALTTLIDAVQEMGEVVTGSSPRNQDQALLLAQAYTELAELVGRHFNAEDAIEAHNQALPILLELNRLHPEWPEVKYCLARNYGALSALIRDGGDSSEAMKKKQDAIELMNEILADNKDNARYAFQLAVLRGEYAEMLLDMRKSRDAVPIVKQSVEAIQGVLGKLGESAPMTPQKQRWQIELAHFLGVQGHAMQENGQKDVARTSFEGAAKVWDSLAAAGVKDEAVGQGQAWVQSRLDKLK
ncbi:MAG: protein kinase [Verrucomicrobiales bacterium]|nr:protein kinase [Verrucomicrobiales bacterium]